MTIFTKNSRIDDIVDENYNLLPVINRLGIKLGNKDLKIDKVCSIQGIDTNFALLIINTFNNEQYFPEPALRSFSPIMIINYLKRTHTYYLDYLIPHIDFLLSNLIKSSKSNKKQLELVEKFYKKYKQELLLHINEEEEKVFPYVLALTNNTRTDKYSIHAFEKEHTNVEEKLNDLKRLLIRYIQPIYDEYICNEFLSALYRFEKDISNHARIEDKILIPQIIKIERGVNE